MLTQVLPSTSTVGPQDLAGSTVVVALNATLPALRVIVTKPASPQSGASGAAALSTPAATPATSIVIGISTGWSVQKTTRPVCGAVGVDGVPDPGGVVGEPESPLEQAAPSISSAAMSGVWA